MFSCHPIIPALTPRSFRKDSRNRTLRKPNGAKNAILTKCSLLSNYDCSRRRTTLREIPFACVSFVAMFVFLPPLSFTTTSVTMTQKLVICNKAAHKKSDKETIAEEYCDRTPAKTCCESTEQQQNTNLCSDSE